MGLIKCPECGMENVSDKAEKCPKCGFPIADHFGMAGTNPAISKNSQIYGGAEKKKRNPIIVVIIVVVSVVVVVKIIVISVIITVAVIVIVIVVVIVVQAVQDNACACCGYSAETGTALSCFFFDACDKDDNA